MSVGNVQKFSKASSLTCYGSPGTRLGRMAQLQSSLFFGLCLIACGPANVKSPPVATASNTQVNGTVAVSKQTHWDFFDVAGTRTPVLLALPKAGNWEVDDQHTPWWVASNATLEMKLEARVWPERRQVTLEDCRTDLGRWRPAASLAQLGSEAAKPSPSAGRVSTEPGRAASVAYSTVHVPQGFDSQLTVTHGKMSGSLNQGSVVLLVGADVSRCFAFLATLTPTTPLADSELMARAALVSEAIVPKIRLKSIEQRIETLDH